jgi:hypothetical protein
MDILALSSDEQAKDVHITEDMLRVDLMDSRTISVPLAWCPRPLNASPEQQVHWQVCGGGYGIH